MAGALAAAALSLALLALGATAASAAPPHAEFVGLQSWYDPTVPELGRVRGANVRVFREQLSWASVEHTRPTGCDQHRCTRHTYYWGRWDQLFVAAAARGVRVLPVLLGSPWWATPDKRWVPVRYRRGYANWKRQAFYDFARQAASRYGAGGSFWKENPELPYRPARHWQIWNEPNLPNYWWDDPDGGRAAREYADLVKRTGPYLLEGDPSARVVTAGLPWSRHGSLDPPPFLREMFSVSGTARWVDLVAIHPYAETPDGMIEYVRLARRAVDGTSARGRRLWLTEIGWASDGPSSRYRTNASTRAERERIQARYLRTAYRHAFRHAGEYGIHGAVWFSLIDYSRSAGEGDTWAYHTGLFRRDRATPKVAWTAMKCATGAGTCRY